MALTIAPIDSNRVRLPDDLQGRASDDPQAFGRFERLLDYVITQLGDVKPCVLVIGNEVDAALGSDAGAWARVPTFNDATSAYAHGLRLHVHGGVGHAEAVLKPLSAAI